MKSLVKRTVGIATVFVAGTLLAQPAPAPLPAPTGTGQVQVGITLTLAEMNAQLPVLDQQVSENTKLVLQLQLDARKDKDVIRLNCINDKYLQIKALQNILDGAKLELSAATELSLQQQHFGTVSRSATQIRQLKEEAVACAGEPQIEADSANTFDAPDIPDNPQDPLFPEVIEPPAYASPFE